MKNLGIIFLIENFIKEKLSVENLIIGLVVELFHEGVC